MRSLSPCMCREGDLSLFTQVSKIEMTLKEMSFSGELTLNKSGAFLPLSSRELSACDQSCGVFLVSHVRIKKMAFWATRPFSDF